MNNSGIFPNGRAHFSMIQRVADTLSFRHDPAFYYVAIFTAYYDTSGSNSGNGYLSTVALVGSAEKWARFDQEWCAVLKEYGVTHLRMSEFVHSLGEFAHFKNNIPKQTPFIDQLLRVIKHGIHKAFLVSLRPKTLTSVSESYDTPDREFRNPYHMCTCHCIEAVDSWMAQKHPKDRQTHIVEKGDTGQSEAKLSECTQYALSTVPKLSAQGDRVRPFEAADLVAYEAKRAHDNMRFETPRGAFRGSYFRLGELLPLETHWLSPSDLQRGINKAPEVFRPKNA